MIGTFNNERTAVCAPQAASYCNTLRERSLAPEVAHACIMVHETELEDYSCKLTHLPTIASNVRRLSDFPSKRMNGMLGPKQPVQSPLPEPPLHSQSPVVTASPVRASTVTESER